METKTIAELGIKLTSLENSYWNHTGAYQEEGERLFEEMVPSMGAASTLNGELIRGINRLTYEYLNNGNCNAAVAHYESEHAYFGEINPFYEKFITLIEDALCEKINSKEVHAVITRIRAIIEDGAYNPSCREYFSKANVNVYSRMADMVIWYVLNTEDTDLPNGYDRN